ncbi:acyl carrier protein [Loktanella sp. SALINAS62]|uniref:acyl carrier protein n=1 Tax=Loktanella sp. SALINAS62 TaxID=2706124 RepID=UPI001B8D9DE1|nr:acyl carrier protein [Loktanella sp. SALINAS62]MBS1301532.1 acyl carrier protein [Loktanella sp. SALINAS62]
MASISPGFLDLKRKRRVYSVRGKFDPWGSSLKKEDLIDFICEDAGLRREDISDDTLLFSDGYIDSFTMTSLIAFIEDEGNMTIEQSAVTLENFDSINNIMAFCGGQNAS